MKDCKVFRKGLCTGCVGLVESDWCGPECCNYYKKLTQQTQFQGIKGKQEKIWK